MSYSAIAQKYFRNFLNTARVIVTHSRMCSQWYVSRPALCPVDCSPLRAVGINRLILSNGIQTLSQNFRWKIERIFLEYASYVIILNKVRNKRRGSDVRDNTFPVLTHDELQPHFWHTLLLFPLLPNSGIELDLSRVLLSQKSVIRTMRWRTDTRCICSNSPSRIAQSRDHLACTTHSLLLSFLH